MTNSTLIRESKYKVNKLRHLNILLAEDNPLNSKLVSILFLQNGVKLQIAENGAEAVEKIKENDYDLVLMDMEMPVLNGYQATTLIRQQLKNNVPIIAMTAHAMAGEREKCLQLGMNDYISKPINEDRLFTAIYNLTSGKKVTGENAGTVISPASYGFEEKVCNLDYLVDATRGNKNMMHNIVEVFMEETRTELSALNAAIIKTNYSIISDISHKIKSSFSLLGITALDPVFAEMEQLATNDSGIEKIRLLSHRINMVFYQAKEEMKGI